MRSPIGWPRVRSPLFVGVVIMVLVGGVGLAVAGDGAGDAPAGGLRPAILDADATREAAVAYLMGEGVSERDARVRLSRESEQMAVATRLRRQAPDDIRSVWIDDDGVLTASVVTDRGVALAEAAGVVPVLVTFAAAELEAARDTLIDDVMNSPPPGFSGASFEIDESVGKVIARYLFAEGPGVVPAAATELGEIVQASTVPGRLTPTMEVQAGDIVNMDNSPSGCTLGWAVDINDGPDAEDQHEGMMTAGHCFNTDIAAVDMNFYITAGDGYPDATGLSYTVGDGDYGFMQLDDEADAGVPSLYTSDGNKTVMATEDPVRGVIVCKMGKATDETCGEIRQVDVSTVVHIDETSYLLSGMVRADYCAFYGDSGGPVYTTYTDFGATDLTITAVGIQSTTEFRRYEDSDGNVGETCADSDDSDGGGYPSVSYFTPLSNMDFENRFFVKIQDG